MSLALLRRAASWTFHPQRKIVFEAPFTRIRDTSPGIPVEFRFATQPDLLALDSDEYGYSAAARRFGLERMKAGDRMVLGVHQGKVVYFGWLMFGQMDLALRQYYAVPVASVYAYKLFTHPHYRGNRICPAFYTYLKQSLRPQGYQRVICWVNDGNTASIRAHSKAGLSRAGAYWQIRLFGTVRFAFDAELRRMGLRPVPRAEEEVGHLAQESE